MSTVTQSLNPGPVQNSSTGSASLPSAPNSAFSWSGPPKDDNASEKQHLFLPLDTRPASLTSRESSPKLESSSNGQVNNQIVVPESMTAAAATSSDEVIQKPLKSSPPKRTQKECSDEHETSPKKIKIDGGEKIEIKTSGKEAALCTFTCKEV